MDVDGVADALREVTHAEVVPRFRAPVIHATGYDLSGPTGAPQTRADRAREAEFAAEKALAARLRAIRNIPVAGEAAAGSNPGLSALASAAPAAWVVDALDGSVNFSQHRQEYATMVALVEKGRAVAGWIYLPEAEAMYAAVEGEGAELNGSRIEIPPNPAGSAAAAGALASYHYSADMRARLTSNVERLGGLVPAHLCSGWDHAALLSGAADFMLFWGTKVWDHAPTSIVVREAGFRVARFTGAEYKPGVPGESLMVAHRDLWQEIADVALHGWNR